jgi:extracellular elastinolytic metalloproteinase
MSKNLDTRDFRFIRERNVRAEAERVSNDVLKGDHVVAVTRVNRFTGGAEHLLSANAPSVVSISPGQGPSDPSLIAAALDHLQKASPALGFAREEAAEFVPDPHVKRTSAGERVVNVQQQYRGIPVFHMERAIRFDPSGALQSVSGSSVGLGSDIRTEPAVPIEVAAKAAAAYVASPDTEKDAWTGEVFEVGGFDVRKFEPKVLGRIPIPCQPSFLDKGPFAEAIPSYLVIFYQGQKTRLGWHFVMTVPEWTMQYVVVVEADEQSKDRTQPQVIYCQETSHDMVVRGNVWVHNPGVTPARQVVDFPRAITDYPTHPTAVHVAGGAFPGEWVDIPDARTVGNNVVAVSGDTTNSPQAVSQGSLWSFDAASEFGDDQKVINIFYFCNVMHDFFYMLGFDERYNFQRTKSAGRGRGGDPVIAHAYPGRVRGTANMLTGADGSSPIMNMGLVSGNQHAAFDSDVVFHEFTHGVSNRLVGGNLEARSLQEPQSRGMGEGWSDYFALTFHNCLGLMNQPGFAERTVLGDWLVARLNGIRLHPYDDQYPGSFGDIGRPPYSQDEHAVGEIWCAALLKMNRDFGQALGPAVFDRVTAHRIGWQIVVDGMKITSGNPSMLDARDGILHALEALQRNGVIQQPVFAQLMRAAWGAFSRFGLGPGAQSNGASLDGVVEDKSLPAGV